MDSVCKRGKPSLWRQQSPLLSHPVSSPNLYFLLFCVMGKISLLPLLLAFQCPFLSPLSLTPSPLFLIYSSCFYSIYPFPPLLSALHASLLLHNIPPHLYSPLYRRMAIKAEGNSLDLKISMSLSLCSCRVASPKAATRYGWPCLFASSGGPYTHSQHTPQDTHTLFKGHSKAVNTSFLQLCYCHYPPSS